MTSTSTSTRAWLGVPTPETTVSVGLFYEGSAFSGVSVSTTEHVRFYAKGDRDASCAIGQATGQVWLQALDDLVAVSKKRLMVSSTANTYLAAKKGITVLAGYTSVSPSSETDPGGLPASVTSYESKANVVSTVWDVAAATMLGVNAAAIIAQKVIGTRFTWYAAEKLAINTAGMALNIANMAGVLPVDVAGMHMFSEGGTYIGACYGSVELGGLAGTMLSALYTTQLGLYSGVIRGAMRVSMSAIGPVDVTGVLWAEATSDGDQTYSARAGTCSVRGVTMDIGAVQLSKRKNDTLSFSDPMTQVSTETVSFRGYSTVSLLSSYASAAKAAKKVAATAPSIEVSSHDRVGIRAGTSSSGWDLEVGTDEVFCGEDGGPMIQVKDGVVSLLAGEGVVDLSTDELVFAAGSGRISIKPNKAFVLEAPELSFK